ncbi:molybdenum ABC transporter ATP-binding protein [Azoarcus sp. DD4]|uniref:ABC transporter ATP-binding protein n=1 Tax=Azoarcus sp. DD4 TaxID=2027405 RepID=UPI00112CCE64|nr:ATP-binding cassette domain-containing protein [Azoarcus sp. DD4]QDF99404.1 molybdenum ABC transporter ATP-binding protein [Azoarcus sp. DD4]
MPIRNSLPLPLQQSALALRRLLGRAPDHRGTADAASDCLQLHLTKALASADGKLTLDVSLRIARGESVALLGPSGSGKTTLLRMLAGLAPADSGHIQAFGTVWLDSARGIALPPRKRRAGLVFQDYALFPNMSARGNLRFALPRGRPPARADDLLDLVGLAGLADRHPAQLSGGQQQRLALARALAAEPELLLLDEPLSALDTRLRRELQDALLALRARHGTTTLLVTHDPAEAQKLADRAVVLEGGRIVADTLPAGLSGSSGESAATGDGRGPALSARVLARVTGTDGEARYRVDCGGQPLLVRTEGGRPLTPGETVRLRPGEWIATPADADPTLIRQAG